MIYAGSLLQIQAGFQRNVLCNKKMTATTQEKKPVMKEKRLVVKGEEARNEGEEAGRERKETRNEGKEACNKKDTEATA